MLVAEPPYPRVVERCHSFTTLGATAADVQLPSPDSKSSESPVPIPTVSVKVCVPEEEPSFQPSVKFTACGREGYVPTVITNGVTVAVVPPATAAPAVEEPSTTVMPPSPVLRVSVSPEDVLPAFTSVRASESVS